LLNVGANNVASVHRERENRKSQKAIAIKNARVRACVSARKLPSNSRRSLVDLGPAARSDINRRTIDVPYSITPSSLSPSHASLILNSLPVRRAAEMRRRYRVNDPRVDAPARERASRYRR